MFIKNLHQWMIQHKKSLAVAESCTGGQIAAAITELPGASDYFLGSFVVYTERMKKIVGVPSDVLKKHGEVSERTTVALWKGVMKKTGADFGIAVTGYAGPKGKSVGEIWYVLGGKDPEVGQLFLKGSRKTIMKKAAGVVLRLLWERVKCIN